MIRLFVNLKRFDVPRRFGGVSDFDDPADWTRWVLNEPAECGAYDHEGLEVVYLLPESSLVAACSVVSATRVRHAAGIEIGSQGVYRSDVGIEGNFGALSCNRPAAVVSAIGCTWTMIGHSEERADKAGAMAAYDPAVSSDPKRRAIARRAVDHLIGEEVRAAAERKLRILLCVGEQSEERTNLDIARPDDAVFAVLAAQLDGALASVARRDLEIVIGYEPIWAIGPGRTPPEPSYIARVADFIKDHLTRSFGRALPVVYGGGLKEQNAETIGGIPSIDGGLVALTRFSGSIGFYPAEFARITMTFLAAHAAATEQQS